AGDDLAKMRLRMHVAETQGHIRRDREIERAVAGMAILRREALADREIDQLRPGVIDQPEEDDERRRDQEDARDAAAVIDEAPGPEEPRHPRLSLPMHLER